MDARCSHRIRLGHTFNPFGPHLPPFPCPCCLLVQDMLSGLPQTYTTRFQHRHLTCAPDYLCTNYSYLCSNYSYQRSCQPVYKLHLPVFLTNCVQTKGTSVPDYLCSKLIGSTARLHKYLRTNGPLCAVASRTVE